MSVIEVQNLRKAFGPVVAVEDLSFDVGEGEILVIVGASGCGKTTTLRCIAGLEQPTSGTIRVDGQTMFADGRSVPPERRGIGMMFQSYALWPHKTVFDNVAYGLRLRGEPRAKIRDAVDRSLSLVGLTGMEDRFPSTLSGGQQQRVALARCAVAKPKVLLLDEPLSNLDAKLRENMRIDLRQMVKDLGMTAIHITHDQTEAMAIADNVIYMRNGRIEQHGTPRQVYRRPATRHVADFVGNAQFVDGSVIRHEADGAVLVRVAEGVELRAEVANQAPETGRATLAIRPETVAITRIRPSSGQVVPGRVVQRAFLGERTEYRVEIGGEIRIVARDLNDFERGEEVFLTLPHADLICFPADD